MCVAGGLGMAMPVEPLELIADAGGIERLARG